jgi:hypothetical protein
MLKLISQAYNFSERPRLSEIIKLANFCIDSEVEIDASAMGLSIASFFSVSDTDNA